MFARPLRIGAIFLMTLMAFGCSQTPNGDSPDAQPFVPILEPALDGSAKVEAHKVVTLDENFDQVADKPEWKLGEHFNRYTRKGQPADTTHKPAQVRDGKVHLLTGEERQSTSIAWPRQAKGKFRNVSARFELAINSGARGATFALLNTQRFGNKRKMFQLYMQKGLPGTTPAAPLWDEPNLWDSFAVGFDVHNPANSDYFDQWGNVHDQPENEVSLHFAGKELFNRQSPVAFRDGKAVMVEVFVAFVTGGAEVSIAINETPVYDAHFIPNMLPYESRIGFGAYTEKPAKVSLVPNHLKGEEKAKAVKASDEAHAKRLAEHPKAMATIDRVHAQWETPASEDPAPVTVHTFRSKLLSRGKGSRAKQEFDLLSPSFDAERIIMTYRLKPPMVRDEWDRLAGVFIYDAQGKRHELARILTPFMLWDVEYPFVVDVTRFKPLLYGKTKLEVFCGANVGDGYCVDLDFTYYKRPDGVASMPKPTHVQTLWSATINFNKDRPDRGDPAPTTAVAPPGTTRAYVRITVTGHGGYREFRPADRTLKVNGKEYTNTLWTTDCYLNPWRPQYGTWKFNRAGWGPGSVGRTWEVDVTEHLKDGRLLKLEYIADELKNKGWNSHVLEAQIFFEE